jgi:hypothetical protein
MNPRRLSKLLATVAGLILALAAVAPVASAEELNPGYEQFAGCPNPFTENEAVQTCVHTEITGGHFQMGSKTVPIENPVTLNGGIASAFEPSPLYFNSEGGLAKVPQKVPGGVVGITGLTWLTEFLTGDALNLYATPVLVGTPIVNGLNEAQLPIKVHLTNPAGVIGKNCYIGSNSNPIVLNLTTGTTNPPAPNEPITGEVPSGSFEPIREIQQLSNGTYVDNAFAAPGANGCVLTLGLVPVNIDALVNLQAGLPAKAGTNETVQHFDAELVNAFYPYE